ncbi:Neuropeptide FF receptor 2 [Mactra antiquata]
METTTILSELMDDNMTTYRNVPLIKQPVHMIIVISIAYGLVFIFGLVGNSFVIALIYKDPSMRNVTNYFILNMAVADILVAVFCVPVTLLGNIYSGMYSSYPYATNLAFI